MHEHIVHTFHDTVPLHPKIFTLGVGPVAIDPNPFRTTGNGLLHDDGSWRWRRCLRGGSGLGFLNDDHSLAVDLLGRAGLRFDDHVRRRLGRLALLPRPHVAIV
jgi:hypothetical protein